jgi:sugar phosphate isomerase/epimerase
MLHLGCVTYNLLKDWDLETIIRNLEAAGYEAVEVRTGHKHGVEPSLNEAQRNQIRERFQKSKVRLLSFGSTCEFESPDAAVRRKQVEIGKQWVSLAHDTAAWGVKVRPNGLPKGVPMETTIENIAASLRELGDYGLGYGVEIWMEVHGPTTQNPPVAAAIMNAAKHQNVGVCWNSNPTDVVNGSVKSSFELLKPWIRNVHINDLSNSYPWRELFTLLREAGYERYTLAEVDPESKEPERFLRYYHALWAELSRA